MRNEGSRDFAISSWQGVRFVFHVTVEPERDTFSPLNGLRGVAAIVVVIYHSRAMTGRSLAPHGYLAVDLFFVLSGFVIAHAYDRRLAAGLGAFRFFWLRVKRFYPLYLVGLLLGAAAVAMDMLRPPASITPTEFAGTLLAGLLFLPLPWSPLYPFNVPAWSLLCELLINLAYGLLWKWPAALALLAAASWLLLFLPSIQNADFVSGILRAGFSFPVGVFIYRYCPRSAKVPPGLVIAGLAAVLLSPVPDKLATTLIFPLGIGLLAVRETSPGFEQLGRLSFPLYAIHYPIIQLGFAVSDRVPIDPMLQGWFWVAIAVGAAWLLSLSPRLVGGRDVASRFTT